jgi:D-aminoacyl-tRNA deacylase
MDIAIVVSTKDSAGMNIKENLLKSGFDETAEEFENHKVYHQKVKGQDIRLYTTDIDSIDCEHIDLKIKDSGFSPELVIFATKHQSASGIHSLSVHAPGNWSKAEFGGEDNKLCIAPARILKFTLIHLEEEAKKNNLGYDLIQECTHHGPYLDTPAMFIEIGSDEESWKNPAAGEAIASTILHLLNNINNIPDYRVAFGIGGPHHTPSFTKVMHRTDICFGHVCPKYMLTALTKEDILQAMEKTLPKADLVVLDWKGLGTEKERIKILLDDLNLEYKKTHSLQQDSA